MTEVECNDSVVFGDPLRSPREPAVSPPPPAESCQTERSGWSDRFERGSHGEHRGQWWATGVQDPRPPREAPAPMLAPLPGTSIRAGRFLRRGSCIGAGHQAEHGGQEDSQTTCVW